MTPRLGPDRISLADGLRHQKWLTLIGLPIMIYSSLNGLYWLWGVLFVWWGITSVRTGAVFLLETIERREDPLLYWIIVGMWTGSGLIYIYTDAVLFL